MTNLKICKLVDEKYCTCHKSRGVFQGDIFIPLILSFRYLTYDETDHGQGCGYESCHHEEAESPDYALIMKSSHSRHIRQGRLQMKYINHYCKYKHIHIIYTIT